MNGLTKLSGLALVGALVSIAALGTAAILFLQTNNESLQRLALLFGLFGVMIPSIIGLLKADVAATQTDETSHIARALDGQFDERVQVAAQRANEASAAGEIAPPVGAAGTGIHTPADPTQIPQ